MTNKGRVFTHFEQVGEMIVPRQGTSSTKLLAGFYDYRHNHRDNVPVLEPLTVETDTLLDLSSDVASQVIEEIAHFCKPETKEKFLELGLVYKRGILLYGPPGTGKTALIMQIARSFIDRGGVALMINGSDDIEYLGKDIKIVREIQKDVPVMFIFEELDNTLSYDESAVLSLLDGEEQIENFICLATTNYIKKVPARIKHRPGRFASVISVSLPTEAARRTYIQAKFSVTMPAAEMSRWLQATDGLTIDDIRECIIAVHCYNSDLDTTIERLKAPHEKE